MTGTESRVGGAGCPEPNGSGPEPLGLAVLDTGHDEVDAALARLEALDGTPPEAHVAVYEDVHGRLRDTLSALDHRPGPPPPSAR